MKCMCGSCWPTYPNFFNPTLNIEMVFGENTPKMGTYSDFVTIFFFKQNLIISLIPTLNFVSMQQEPHIYFI